MRAEHFINQVQRLLGDPEGQFHTTENMLSHLNTALEEICTRSRTLCTWLYVAVVNGQGFYGLPESFLEFKYVGYFYNGHLYPLTPGNIADAAPAIFREPQYNHIPHTYAEGGNAFVEKVVTTVQTSEQHENVYPGVGTGTFVAGAEIPTVHVGDRLLNITDNSEGEITDVDPPSGRITYDKLDGGEDNTMAKGDEFRILSKTEHRYSIAISPPPTKTDPTGTESLYIYLARNHTPITQQDIDNKNDEIELSTEFNTTLRHRVMYYASMENDGIDHPATITYDVKYETDYMSAFPKANRRIREYISAWRSKTHRIPNNRNIITMADWQVKTLSVR